MNTELSASLILIPTHLAQFQPVLASKIQSIRDELASEYGHGFQAKQDIQPQACPEI